MKFITTLLLWLSIVSLSILSNLTYAQSDLMDTIFQPSKNLDQVINIGNNKNAVGNQVFQGSMGLSFDEWITQEAPLLVKITQTLLRLTIALSIPVIIYIGVKLIKNAMNWGKVKEAIQEVSWVLLWLALALSAMWIIYLIQSIAMRSLSWVI